MNILSPEADNCLNEWKGENDHRKYFMISLHERMLPSRRGSNPQPPDHQSDEHPTEPPRPATQTHVLNGNPAYFRTTIFTLNILVEFTLITSNTDNSNNCLSQT